MRRHSQTATNERRNPALSRTPVPPAGMSAGRGLPPKGGVGPGLPSGTPAPSTTYSARSWARRAAWAPGDWLSASGVAIGMGQMHDPSHVVGPGFTRAPVALTLRLINLVPIHIGARIEDDAEGVR